MNTKHILKRYLLIAVLLNACSNESETVVRADSGIVKQDTLITSLPDTAADPSIQLIDAYENSEYGFSLQTPVNWQVHPFSTPGRSSFALNVIPKRVDSIDNAPLNVHADASLSYIAIYPGGYGTELPSGEVKTFRETYPSLSLSFAVDPLESRVFYLQNGLPWAYFIVPAEQPSSWRRGFIFAQVGVDNFSVTCYDKETGNVKEASACDPLMGDKVVRNGNLREEERILIKKMLTSLSVHTVAKSNSPE